MPVQSPNQEAARYPRNFIESGNALFAGGNDCPAEQAGVISISIRNPFETKRVTETITACLGDDQQTRMFASDRLNSWSFHVCIVAQQFAYSFGKIDLENSFRFVLLHGS